MEQMVQKLQLKYINKELKVGMVNWKQVYLLHPVITPLRPEVDKGRLVYRAKGTSKRISYAQIKKGLVKENVWIKGDVLNWLPAIR